MQYSIKRSSMKTRKACSKPTTDTYRYDLQVSGKLFVFIARTALSAWGCNFTLGQQKRNSSFCFPILSPCLCCTPSSQMTAFCGSVLKVGSVIWLDLYPRWTTGKQQTVPTYLPADKQCGQSAQRRIPVQNWALKDESMHTATGFFLAENEVNWFAASH